MKRWILYTVAVMYALLSIGVHIHLHYCGSNLKHFSLLQEEHSCCPHEHHHESDEVHSNCCSDENFTFQTDDEHTGSFFFFNSEVLAESRPIHGIFEALSEEKSIPVQIEDNRPPPLLRPAYILFQSPIYYA
jgi:hypothetical protein